MNHCKQAIYLAISIKTSHIPKAEQPIVVVFFRYSEKYLSK